MLSSAYCYVFIRQNIPLADQICQVAHACLEAGRRFAPPEHANLVLLAVNDEKSLLKVEEKCKKHGVNYAITFEPDPIETGGTGQMGHTCVATGPISGETRNTFRNYNLWKADRIVDTIPCVA